MIIIDSNLCEDNDSVNEFSITINNVVTTLGKTKYQTQLVVLLFEEACG